MLTLVIDTSLHTTQAALFDDETCLVHKTGSGERCHAETLLPLIEAARQEAQIDFKKINRVVVTVGPGIFTGIRIGISCARSFGLALKIPVLGVTTLSALSCQSKTEGAMLALIDAHKGEVYAQEFSAHGAASTEPRLLNHEAAQQKMMQQIAAIAYPSLLKTVFESTHLQLVDALDVNAILKASTLPSATQNPLPVYVRAPDALPSSKPALRRA